MVDATRVVVEVADDSGGRKRRQRNSMTFGSIFLLIIIARVVVVLVVTPRSNDDDNRSNAVVDDKTVDVSELTSSPVSSNEPPAAPTLQRVKDRGYLICSASWGDFPVALVRFLLCQPQRHGDMSRHCR